MILKEAHHDDDEEEVVDVDNCSVVDSEVDSDQVDAEHWDEVMEEHENIDEDVDSLGEEMVEDVDSEDSDSQHRDWDSSYSEGWESCLDVGTYQGEATCLGEETCLGEVTCLGEETWEVWCQVSGSC